MQGPSSRSALLAAAVGAALLAAASPASGTAAGWLDRVTQDLRTGEYHLSPDPAQPAWTAPNRAHDLRTRWFRDGLVRIESRTAPGGWTLEYRLAGTSRGATFVPAGPVLAEQVAQGRLTWSLSGLEERYRNGEHALEQGFTLHDRPAGTAGEPVVLEGTLEGLLAYPSEDGRSVLLRSATGVEALRIGSLQVSDARGARLPACLEVVAGGLLIRVDDGEAVYPVTVDSWMTGPTWSAEGDQAGARFGASVATAGDVDGDGFGDVVVGAPWYDNGEPDEGRAHVFLGSASGLAATPAWSAEGDQAGALFGDAVATAGDVNSDGFSDLVIGAPGHGNGQSGEGRAYVYHGSASGLATTPAWTAESNQAFARFGASVGPAGDVNSDGFGDVIVGAPGYSGGEAEEGGAFVYHGSRSGLAANPAWTAEGNQASARFGSSVATAGDVNGDGFHDVIVGAPEAANGQAAEGRAYVYHGSASGLAANPAWSAESNQVNARFGVCVATAGDVNGDGFSDVIAGASQFSNGESSEGRAFVYHGSATGLATTPAWTAESNQADGAFGTSVGSAGDVNGDGFGDVIVGAPGYDDGERDEGLAAVYQGSALGLAAAPAWTAQGNQDQAGLGKAVAMAGDVNGDGYGDVIVGAHLYDNPETDEGRAFVYHGSAAGLTAAPAWIATSNQRSALLGVSVASAGDVNGDGFSDVIVGAWYYDGGRADEGAAFVYHGSPAGLAATPAWTAEGNQANAHLGSSVAGAGDVNGDGYSDVIVGAPYFENGETFEGRALVYLGSPAGLLAVPAWSAEGNQASAAFGTSVATAGDVNGDGYSDVIVGAIGFSNGHSAEGGAFVYQGSPGGLAATPAWIGEGNQAFDFYGTSVATAGDVNGDGYSDVIVGAPHYDDGEADEGRAFVYHGSPSGLGTTPAWSAEGNQANAAFGGSVATAGDVDGDGYSDVLVGAQDYDAGETNEGRAFLFLGSPGGLASAAAWTAESNQANARLGSSVATAGDVNGDGYSDVILGALSYDNGETDEGRAFVYLGSALGLAAAPAWTAESNQAGASFGTSVATAGDVNGDGYCDVIVGAPNYADRRADEGGAFVYYGNDGDGLDRIPRQARADASAPIDLLGAAATGGGFRLRASGRTPFGRGPVRLEWEVKPLGVPFDRSAVQTSAWFDTGAPGGAGSLVPLEELHAPLPGPGPYRWRLRLRGGFPFPFPWHSHWMSLPYNNRTETDLRTMGAPPGCGLDFADVTFPPVNPPRSGSWVYVPSCGGQNQLPTELVPSVSSGSLIDALGGPPGMLRLYQLSCGCPRGMLLAKSSGRVRLETY